MCIVTHWKLAKMQILGLKPRDPGNSNVDSPRPNFEKHQFTVWKQILQIKHVLMKITTPLFLKREVKQGKEMEDRGHRRQDAAASDKAEGAHSEEVTIQQTREWRGRGSHMQTERERAFPAGGTAGAKARRQARGGSAWRMERRPEGGGQGAEWQEVMSERRAVRGPGEGRSSCFIVVTVKWVNMWRALWTVRGLWWVFSVSLHSTTGIFAHKMQRLPVPWMSTSPGIKGKKVHWGTLTRTTSTSDSTWVGMVWISTARLSPWIMYVI